MADWPLRSTRTAWFPVVNPSMPQPPPGNLTIEIGRRPAQVDGSAGAYTRFARVSFNPAASAPAWPGALPLFVCDPGTQALSGRLNCTPCISGRFSDACGGFACLACPPTTYTAAPGQTACSGCDAGFACPGGSDRMPCPAGLYSDGAASTCSLCTPRQYCPGPTAPIECPAGTSNYMIGQSTCALCAPGNFSSEVGAAICLPCSAGSFAGSAGATTCTACKPGSFAAFDSAAVCDFCPEDQYQSISGATVCLLCPVNMGARWSMGLCSGACGGSVNMEECVCKAGYTSFGQAGSESGCIQLRLESAKVGQMSSCAGSNNLLTLTFSYNAALTTAVQEI